MARVRVGSLYTYNPNPCGWDSLSPCMGNNLKSGDVVRVINLPGAPQAGVMGHCYVASPETGKFICMVATDSLSPVKKAVRR